MLTREQLIVWILEMKQLDPDYARTALAWYVSMLPWLNLNAGVGAALKTKP